MRYVVDSSVAFKWLVPEAHGDQAIQLREDFRRGAHSLIAPDVFAIEVAHGLTRAERQGRIPVSQSSLHLTDLFAMLPALVSSLTLLARACEISSQLRVGIYDCLYLALAEQEQCQFVTADQRLISAVRQQYSIVHLSSLP